MKKLLLVSLFAFVLIKVGTGQPWTYNFGTAASSSYTTANSFTTTFMPTAPSGTARVRVGTTGGGFYMDNAGLAAIGTADELRIVAPTSASINKFSIYGYTASKSFYTKFFILLGSSSGGQAGAGIFSFFQGSGASFSDNNAFTSTQIFTGFRWVYGASGTLTTNYRNGATWTALGSTPFKQEGVYMVELFGNNTTGTISYTYNGTSTSVASNKWDIYINGVLIGDDLAKGGYTNDTNLDSWMFYGESSASNAANIFIDDMVYSNSIPSTVTSDVNYYSKSSGALESTSNWVTNIDGTGAIPPPNFTSVYSVYNIQNNASPTIGANWTVSGSNSRIQVGNGTTACSFAQAFNLSCPTLVINPLGGHTITAGKTLSVSGNLTIKSDVNGTGSFIGNSADYTISGTTTVQRYMTKYNASGDKMYHLLSSPVSSQAIQPGFSDPPNNATDDFYKYDETQSTWINFRDGAGTGVNGAFGSNFAVGKGYLVAYNADATKTFTGTLNSGTLTTGTGLPALTYTPISPGGGGWNLLGNPYASAIDWNNVTSGQYANIDNAVYVYDNAAQLYKSYASGVGLLTGGIVPAMQGFFIKANAASPSLTLENQDRVISSQAYYKSAADIQNVLELKVEGNERYDETFVRFQDGATADFNSEWDAYKLMGGPEVPNLYTTVNSVDYSINTLPVSSKDNPLPLNLKVGTQNSYLLTASNLGTFASSTVITLKDLSNNHTQNLMTEPAYQFTAGPDDNAGRFMLYFSGPIGIHDQGSKNIIQVYSNEKTIYISGLDSRRNSDVFVYNILGQEILHRNINGQQSTINMTGFSGYAIVKVMSENGVKTVKVCIN